MALELSQIREILKSPPKSPQKRLAIEHEQRVRFHSETTLGSGDTSNALNEFLRFVKGVLKRDDKFNVFLHLLRFPIDTVSVTEEIYKALEKVYDGQNPVYDYEFSNEEILADWEQYRIDSKQDDFWRYEAWEAMKTQINSIMVVDLEREQNSTRPEPYTYFLNLGDTIAYKTQDGDFEFLVFWSNKEEKEIAVFDEEKYWLFKVDDKREIQDVLVESPHELSYCPARFFWTTPKSTFQKEIKKSPISNELGKLDWLLFYSISKKQLDTYGSYPIISVFNSDCDFEHTNTITGDHESCHNGFMQNSDGNYILLNDRTTGYGALKQCPVCSKNSLTGAGSIIKIDAPDSSEDPDLRNPIQFHQIDRAILDYNVEEVERLTGEIILKTTGGSIEAVNDQAVNEKQIMSLFESRKAVLVNIQENLERARKWSDQTQCLLRYGENLFQSCFISMGTEYFLFSEPQLWEIYNGLKKSGTTTIQLDYLQDQIFETKFKNNREGLERAKTLVNLEPFRHLTASEVQGFNVTTPKELYLKLNFSSLIQRFERENTNVVSFGNEIEFDQKIQRIKEVLESYISLPEQQPQPIE